MIFPRNVHYLNGIDRIFSILFVFCMSRAQNLAEKDRFSRVSKKKLNSAEAVEPDFYNSAGRSQGQLVYLPG